MNGREIPGFYFDAAKKKYFKIHPDHIATPESQQYSRTSVAKIKTGVERKLEKSLHDEKNHQQRVRRAKILSSPWCGAPLERERCVSISRSNARGPAMYASGLNGAMVLERVHFEITACIRAHHFDGYLIGKEEPGPRAIVIDDASHKLRIISMLTSSVSSIATTNNGTVMITTIGSHLPAQVLLYTPEHASPSQQQEPQPLFRRLLDRRLHEQSIFACASNAFNAYEDTFVVGTSRQALAITVGNDRYSIADLSLTTDSHVLATEWLSHNVAILGHRNGTVQLWDLRTSGTSARLKHPSSISAIRPIDSNKFIVAGILNSIHMYDLRMPILSNTPPRGRKSRYHIDHSSKSYTSTPVVHYDYSNHYDSGLGLDISTNIGVLAAADDERHINIFALNSGLLLKRFPLHDSHPGSNKDPIRNILFHHEPHGEVITATSGGTLYRTDWGRAPGDWISSTSADSSCGD